MGTSIIAAMSRNRVIGRQGAIPWDIPEDRRRFRELTFGHTVIMGRHTFESIGRPLAGRRNVVVTGLTDYSAEGAVVVHSLAEALAASDPADELFICGGSGIYELAMMLCSKIYLTLVDLDIEGDRYFPCVPAEGFQEVSREVISESPPAELIIFEKRPPPPGASSP